MNERFHVVIVGGGMVGLTLGLALARAGLSAAVVDRADLDAQATAAHDGRASAIASASARMFGVLGLGELFATHAQAIRAIQVTDGGRPPVVEFDAGEGGALGYMIENRLLRAALLAAVRAEPSLTLIAPAVVAATTREVAAATVTLADRRTLTAELLIAADGRASPLREAAGIRAARWTYAGRALVATVHHTEPHGAVAHEIFYPAGPLALLPMVDDHGSPRSAIVWTRDGRAADGLAALGPRGLSAELTASCGHWLGDCTLAGPPAVYPLALHHAERYAAERLVLIGDAAHGIHPIAGQGLNMGLRDIAALAEVLGDAARTGVDLGSAAPGRAYERWRRLDNSLVAATTDGLNRLFAIPGRLPAAIRRAGLGAVRRTPALQNFFMAEARGERGDLPRLLRGEAL